MNARTRGAAEELPSLTGLRGLAALWVVTFHVFVPASYHASFLRVFLPFVQTGGYAVDTFFILSGFIMMHVYGTRKYLGKHRWYLHFLAARFARIYPAYFAALVVFLLPPALSVLFSHHLNHDYLDTKSILLHLFLVQNWGIPATVINQPCWSVSAEWFAYLFVFAPCVFLFLRLQRWTQFLAMALLSYAVMVLNLWAGAYEPVHPQSLDLIRVAAEFSLGTALYGLRTTQTTRLASLAVGNDFLFGGICIAMLLTTCKIAGGQELLLALLGPWLLGLSFRQCEMGRLLARPSWIWLGSISYSLYVIHDIVLHACYHFYPLAEAAAAGPWTLLGVGSANMLASLLAAALLFYLVEAPARGVIRRLLDRVLG